MTTGDDSQGVRPSTHDELSELAVGQAFHALEPEDEQRLAVHLLGCASCARMVVEAAETGAAMATLLEPETPPPGLRERLLAAAAQEPRPEGPAARRDPPATAATPAPASSPSARGAVDPAPRSHPSDGRRGPRRGSPAPAQRGWRRPRVLALTAVAAAVIGAAVAVPTTLSLNGSGTGTTQSALARAIAAPGTRTVSLTGGGGASGRAVVSSQGLYLVVDGLPHNDARSTTYVLWSIPGTGERTAVATFDVSGTNPVVLAQPGNHAVPEDAALAVSYEKGRAAPAQPTDVMLSSRA